MKNGGVDVLSVLLSDEFPENAHQVTRPERSRHLAINEFGKSLKPEESVRDRKGIEHHSLRVLE